MKLHQNQKLFKSAVLATADLTELPPEYIEKDYWVTLALKEVFNSEAGKIAVFKGGTAIAKCYKLIERFSEDIDLVTIRGNKSANQLKLNLKAIGKTVSASLPEIEIDGLTHKKGMIRKTVHEYPKVFNGNYGHVRDKIILESTWLGYSEPYVLHYIHSFIHDMMLKTDQKELATMYDLEPFEVRVLDVRRTFCEKIMSLVRFSQTEAPVSDLKMKVRHLYDLHQLLKLDEISEFMNSKNFESMILRVAHDDVYSFKNNNGWLINHPKDVLIFKRTEQTIGQLVKTYTEDFAPLVFGDLPTIQEIIQTINKIGHKLAPIEWKVAID